MPVRSNFAVYEAKYNDIQAQFVTVSPSGLPEALIVNYDPFTGTHNKATLTGGEAEVTFIPMPQLHVTAFYGYASGKYDTFVNCTSARRPSAWPASRSTASPRSHRRRTAST